MQIIISKLILPFLKKVIFRWEINTESKSYKACVISLSLFILSYLRLVHYKSPWQCSTVVMIKDLGIRQTQSQGSNLPLANHVTLGKLHHFSVPWLPQLYTSTYLMKLLGRLNELYKVSGIY